MKKHYETPDAEGLNVSFEENIMSVTGNLPGQTGWDGENDEPGQN